MRMQKEEKIVVVMLLMALGSLAVAFWAFGPDESKPYGTFSSASQNDAHDAGISVEGQVLEIKPTRSGGNLLLKLDSTPLPIFIPSKAGAEVIQNNMNLGDRVQVDGTVSSFQGNDEITVDRATDIVFIK
jgi:hypothetical protein